MADDVYRDGVKVNSCSYDDTTSKISCNSFLMQSETDNTFEYDATNKKIVFKSSDGANGGIAETTTSIDGTVVNTLYYNSVVTLYSLPSGAVQCNYLSKPSECIYKLFDGTTTCPSDGSGINYNVSTHLWSRGNNEVYKKIPSSCTGQKGFYKMVSSSDDKK
jgi:hypothetical protein